MKKLVSLLLIITCLFTLGACAKKQNPVANPTPAVNTQEGDANDDKVVNSGDDVSTGDGNVVGSENDQQQPGDISDEPAVSADASTEATPTATNTVADGGKNDSDIAVKATPTATNTVAVGEKNDSDTTVKATPTATVDASVDLEEDILTNDNVVVSTSTPTPTSTPAPTQSTSSDNDKVTSTPTAKPTATATLPPLVDGDTVISLPMDIF